MRTLAHNILRSVVTISNSGPVIDTGQLELANCGIAYRAVLAHFNEHFPSPPGDYPLSPELFTLRYLCGIVAYTTHPNINYSAFGQAISDVNVWLGQSFRRLLFFANIAKDTLPDVVAAAKMTAANELAAWHAALLAAPDNDLILLDPEIFANESAVEAEHF